MMIWVDMKLLCTQIYVRDAGSTPLDDQIWENVTMSDAEKA